MRSFLLAVALGVPALFSFSAQAQSCVNRCGGFATTCWCDDACTSYGDCCSNYLSVCRVPTINAVTPARLSTPGGVLTLSGAKFGSTQGSVQVGSLACAPTSWAESAITCTLPAGTGAGLDARVTSAINQSGTSSGAFSFEPPSVASLQPLKLPTAGGVVTLTGANFGAAGAQVEVGGVPATIGSQGHAQLVVTAPEGEGASQPVLVRVNGQNATATLERLAPHITQLMPSPVPAAAGTLLTLSGSNFGLTPTVTVGGVACPVTTRGHDSVVCQSPGVSTAQLTVRLTAAGQQSNTFLAAGPSAALTGLTPTSGPTIGGITLTLSGVGLDATPASVTVGGALCSISLQSATELRCIAPPGDGSGRQVVATLGGNTSNTLLFSYASPIITGINPASGPTLGGTVITLTGNNFAVTSAPQVWVGSNNCAVLSNSASQVRCTLPAGSGQPPVTLTQSGQRSNESPFRYDGPSISQLLPALPPTAGGIALTLTGSNFGDANAQVSVDSMNCPVTSQGHTQLVCTLPAGRGGTVPVRVRTPSDSVGATTTLTWAPAVVSGLTPSSGPAGGGTTLIITGNNFGSAGRTVTVGGRACPVVSGGHTQVTCLTPEGEGIAPVVLQPGSVAAGNFTYAAPSVTSLTPSTGSTAGGYPVTISGSSFGSTASVRVDGSPATVTQVRDGSLTFTMPAGQGVVSVSVTRGAQSSASLSFTYGAPAISGLTPSGGSTAGGVPLTIQGTNFGTSGTVTVGGSNAPVTSWGHTQVVVTLPAGAGNTVPVVLGRAGETASSTYSYGAPAISGLTPIGGSTAGGVPLTIQGTNFGTSGTVSVGGSNAPVTSWGHTQVVVTLPAGAGNTVPVVLGRAGETASSTYSYGAPAISGVTPSGGSTAGGVPLTIQGTNFSTSGTVSVGGSNAPVTSWGHSQVVVTLPASEGGSAPLVLTRAGETASSTYSYGAPQVSGVSPASAATAGGITLTLTGNNFGTGAATTVSVGSRACTGLSSTHSQVTCTLPEGEGLGVAVSVTVAGAGASSTFDYAAPSLNSVSPVQVPSAGAVLTLSGANFGLTPSVTVGSTSCPVLTRTHGEVTCTAPAGSGTQPVRLTVAGQSSGTLDVTYPALNLTSFFPRSAPTRGGTLLTLEGSGLAQATFTISGAACPVLKATATSALCVLPPTPAGPATVVATSAAGTAVLTGLEFVPSCGSELAEGASCDDGQQCTGAGRCVGTRCEAGVTANEGLACDDGNSCTGAGVCSSGACVAAAANAGASCVAAQVCTGVGTCSAGVCDGAPPAREGLSCDDGVASTQGEVCSSGACSAPVVSDAGMETDAGTDDAGTDDAGTDDAGTDDAGTQPDAGPEADAGTSPTADAGSGADAGMEPPMKGDGCGCTTLPGAGWLALLLLGVFGRRRRS